MPVLRLAGLRAEGASRTAPLPAPPGNASLGLAVSATGLQVGSEGSGFRVQLHLLDLAAFVTGLQAIPLALLNLSLAERSAAQKQGSIHSLMSAECISCARLRTGKVLWHLQVWLSPYQVAHGVALAENIAATLPRLRAAPLPPPAAAAAAEVRSEFAIKSEQTDSAQPVVQLVHAAVRHVAAVEDQRSVSDRHPTAVYANHTSAQHNHLCLVWRRQPRRLCRRSCRRWPS